MKTIELQNYEIDIRRIKPKNVKRSNKYSKAIYKYLKENPCYRRVWFDKTFYDSSSQKNIRVEFDVNNMNLRNMYFGMPESPESVCITGKQIDSLIQGGSGSQSTYCYIGYDNSQYVEVTEAFYKKYIEIGRCIYGHGLWITDDEDRYTYYDDTHRKCNWCGKGEHLETKTYSYSRDVWIEN